MSENYQTLIVTSDAAGLWQIRLNDTAKRNALTRQMRLELIAALEAAQADTGCRGLILSGEGNVFCAGGDISSMGQSVEASMEGLELLHIIVRLLARFPRPVVAAVQGGAYGAGFSLALLADAIVASPGTKFAASFGKMGLAPDTGFMWSIQRRISMQKALGLIATTRLVEAEEALALGLIDEVSEDILGRAFQLVRDLATAAPMTLAQSKHWLTQTSGLEAHLALEAQSQHQMYLSQDHKEAVAAFREKRVASFIGQ